MKRLFVLLFAASQFVAMFSFAQIAADKMPTALQKQPWKAKWIAVPNTAPKGYGVYHFRKSFDLPVKPTSFIVHVSGDNRYKLFVNGQWVSFGPARSDVEHWHFETVDLAPY